MKIFVEPSHAVPMVKIVAAFEGGAAEDPAGKEGLANITARMLRRGATGMVGNQLEARLDLLGADFSTRVGYHTTTIRMDVIRRSLDPAVELLGKVIGWPSFDEAALARLLREAEAEMVEGRDNDGWLVQREAMSALFGTHPYGVKTTPRSIRAITRADVIACYAHLYDALEAVSVAGDVREEDGQDAAHRLAASMQRTPSPSEPRKARAKVGEPAARSGRHLVFVDKPERTQNPIVVATLGTHGLDPDHFPLLVANAAFGGTFNARLMEEVRGKRGWSYGAYSGLRTDRRRAAFMISVTPKAADTPGCLALVLEMLGQFREQGITQAELDRMKRFLVRSHAFEVETAAQRVWRRMGAFLNQLPEEHSTRFVERVQAVTLDEANAAVRTRLSDRDLVVSAVGTYAEHGEGLAKAIQGLESSTVVPFDAE